MQIFWHHIEVWIGFNNMINVISFYWFGGALIAQLSELGLVMLN